MQPERIKMAHTDHSFEALLDEHQVAKLLNISIATIRRRRLLRQPPDWVKIGASVRYEKASVQRLIESSQHRTEAQ